MQIKKISFILIVFLSIIAGLFLGNLIAGRAISNGLVTSFSSGTNKLQQLLSVIDQHYVDSVNVDSITEAVAADLISKLDPHSVYIPATELEDVNSELESSFSGIGVQFNIQNDTVMIVAVIPGGPSEKVGLMAGDRIVKVNDTTFVGKDITNKMVMKKLRGPEGTKVVLKVLRSSSPDLLKYEITRGAVPVNSVDIAYMVAPGTGLIKVSKFAVNTYSEFLNAIADLKSKGAKRFIVDLRENSGGFMDQAINMVNEFLPKDRMIVYSEGKAYPRSEARSDGSGSCITLPIVVLIDEFSASASEIFAGAIQDNDRGIIIGRRSFGKGLVQQQMDLSDGSAVRLTVARYYTPSGRSIQKPYEKGNAEAYESDLLNRFKHGEFDSKDSIQLSDSLKYKTLAGRTVYGGGGIMPDIFVSRDTSNFTPYLQKVFNQGYLYQFSFFYADVNRAQLKSFKTWQALEAYLLKQDLLSAFVNYAQNKGVPANSKQIAISKQLIENQLRAYIVRNVVGDTGFYPIQYKSDKVVLRALQQLTKK